MTHLRSKPAVNGYCDLRLFQTGGAINHLAPRDTAFVHRDSRWLLVVGLYWDQNDQEDAPRMARAHAWQDGFYMHRDCHVVVWKLGAVTFRYFIPKDRARLAAKVLSKAWEGVGVTPIVTPGFDVAARLAFFARPR